jgi:hypothetical protein
MPKTPPRCSFQKVELKRRAPYFSKGSLEGIMKNLLGLSLLLASFVSMAGEVPRYEAELRAVQGRVAVEIYPAFTFFEKVEAIHNLHEAVINSEVAQNFGPTSLINKVVLNKIHSKEPADEIAHVAKVRGRTFMFTSKNETFEALKQRLPLEIKIANEIVELESELVRRYPNLKLTRDPDFVTNTLPTNESYLQLLRNLESAWMLSRNSGIDNLDAVYFTDSGSHTGGINFEKTLTSGKERLFVRISRPWSLTKDLEIHETFIAEAFKIIFQMGFRKVESQLLELQETPMALQTLHNRLTPARAARLREMGIEGFIFSSSWRSADDLIKNKMLILGSKPEDIDEILNYYLP